MDADLRKLRYFAALAEHQHFGRAAAALHITQPVLSRQIRALEHELGATLLVRTTRSVALTAAGEQLRQEIPGVLATTDGAVRRVQEVARGVERLVVAFSPGLHVSGTVRAFGADHPDVEIELLRLQWWERAAPLRDGRADVAVLRRPFDEDGLRVEVVGHEAKGACLPVGHPLARRSALSMADLEGEPVLDTRTRRPASLEEKFELIAAGYGYALVPSSVAESYSRTDVVHRPVIDAEPVETCVAVRRDRRERRVRDFAALAVATLRADRAPASGAVAVLRPARA